jgi:hypothetical protein
LINKAINILKKYKALSIVSSTMVALIVAIVMIVSGKTTATAGIEPIMRIPGAPEVLVTAMREHFAVPIADNDGLSVTVQRNVPVEENGLSKNREVTLTAPQADFTAKFAKYLTSIGQAAVVTSGERSPENQLGLIKERIQERGAEDQFPGIQTAGLQDTKIWVDAWKWLRGRRVPVYAPTNVPGEKLTVSNHLKGMAIDFVGKNLDQVKGWLNNFSNSSLGKTTVLRITSIAREPGCIHINLDERA